MNVPYYEAIFRDEEPDERVAEWHVVKWDSINPDTGAKSGRRVKRFPGTELGGADAIEAAEKLNKMKESENA